MGRRRAISNVAPPRSRAVQVRGLEYLPQLWRENATAPFRGEPHDRFAGFIPIVESEVERPPVHGQQGSAAEHFEDRKCVGGAEVNVTPALVKRTNLQENHVEGTMTTANLAKLLAEARIPGKKDLPPIALDHPRRPQGHVAIARSAPRKVLARRCREAQPLDVDGLFPVELEDQPRFDTHRLESCPDAQRSDYRHPELRDPDHRLVAQVIVVVVREQHRIEFGQLLDLGRNWMEAFGTGKPHR